MASLMENLIDVLKEENTEYLKLTELSNQKKSVIVAGDTVTLQKITDEEQDILNRIAAAEKRREEITGDVANVLNKDVETLKLADLIRMLAARPAEQKKLAEVHGTLSATVKEMMRVNEQNRVLIQNALELVEFDMNLLQAVKAAPETANYNRGAYNTGSIIGDGAGSFDAKQ